MAAFIQNNVNAVIRVKKIYMNVQVEMVDQQAQAPQWVDHHFMARYEEDLREAEDECFSKDLHIEEFEQDLKKMKEHVADFTRARNR